jgi:hypothetical protein
MKNDDSERNKYCIIIKDVKQTCTNGQVYEKEQKLKMKGKAKGKFTGNNDMIIYYIQVELR